MSEEHIMDAGQKALQILAVMLAILDLAHALATAASYVAFMQEASWLVGP